MTTTGAARTGPPAHSDDRAASQAASVDAAGADVQLGSGAGRRLLAVAVLGSALTQLEATVVNVALPAIGEDLGADVGGLQWVLNGYLLVLAALILLGGSLGDRYGRRRVFVLGVVVFTAASAACAAAPSTGVLVAARAVQGVGGALLTPGSLAMLEALLRPADRARAIGAWSALGGIAAAVGPLLGGLLVEVSWRWVFLLPVPLGAAVALIATARVPESRDPGASGRVDSAGAALASTALAGLTYALVQAGNGVSGPVLAAGLLGLAAAAAFVAVERRTERRAGQPMLPLSLFSSRPFTAANALTFVVYAALGGVFFLLVVVLQTAVGYSPLAAGAASLPITAIMLVLSSRAGALAQRMGPRVPLSVGPALVAAGMLLMLRIGPSSAGLAGYARDVLPAVVVFGLGLAAVVAPVTATVLAAVEDRHAGVASGVNNAVARTAQLAAVATLPLAVGLSGATYADPQALTTAFHHAMVLTAGLSLVGSVIAWTTIRSDVLQPAASAPQQAPAAPDVVHLSHCATAGPPPRATVGATGQDTRAPGRASGRASVRTRRSP